MSNKIKLLTEGARAPTRATQGSAGHDIYVSINTVLKPGIPTLVKTGIAIQLEKENVHAFILPRSSLAKSGIVCLNSPGLVDNDYRGEIMVLLLNSTETPVMLLKGNRIAQIVFMKAYPIDFTIVGKLDKTEREADGFGSTGR